MIYYESLTGFCWWGCHCRIVDGNLLVGLVVSTLSETMAIVIKHPENPEVQYKIMHTPLKLQHTFDHSYELLPL